MTNEKLMYNKKVKILEFIPHDIRSELSYQKTSLGNGRHIYYDPKNDKGAIDYYQIDPPGTLRPQIAIDHLRPIQPGTEWPRYPRTGVEIYQRHLEEFFSPKKLDSIRGKNVLIPYLDSTGYGHMMQAWDMAIFLQSLFQVRTIFFDPVYALTSDQKFIYDGVQRILKGLHLGKIDIAKLKDLFKNRDYPPGLGGLKHKITDQIGLKLAEMALATLPIKGETSVASRLIDNIGKLKLLEKFMLNLFPFIEKEISERSLASRTLQVAQATDAIGLITSHSFTIRGADPFMYKRYIGERPFSIVSAIPDNGYIDRYLPDESANPTMIEKGQLLVPFVGGVLSPKINYGVADEKVKKYLENLFGIKSERVFDVGTIADSITPKEFIEKWQQKEKKVLLPVNGNASNLPFITQALKDLGDNRAKEWLKENQVAITVYLGDKVDRVEEVRRTVEENGLQDHVEIFYSRTKSGAAELKQVLQRNHHIEWRSPGENILTGGDVGTCEVGLATPGLKASINEVYNMKYMAEKGAAIPSSYPLSSYGMWADMGFSPGQFGLLSLPLNTFQEMLAALLEKEQNGRTKAENIAFKAYSQANHDTNFRVAAIFLFDYFKPEGRTLDDLLKMFDQVNKEHQRIKMEKFGKY